MTDEYLRELKWLAPAAKTRAGEMVAEGERAARTPGVKPPEDDLDAFLFHVGRSRGLALQVVDDVSRALDAAADLAPRRDEGAMETDRGRTYAERIALLVKLAREGRGERAKKVPEGISGLDLAPVAWVEALIETVKEAGLTDAANLFSNVYWAWLRTVSAYRAALPYVERPEEPSMTPFSALHVTTFTIEHWGSLIPGTPTIDNEAVRDEAAADEEWHRQEDRRLRRESGEEGQ
jgi:hypothetical protein